MYLTCGNIRLRSNYRLIIKFNIVMLNLHSCHNEIECECVSRARIGTQKDSLERISFATQLRQHRCSSFFFCCLSNGNDFKKIKLITFSLKLLTTIFFIIFAADGSQRKRNVIRHRRTAWGRMQY